MADVGDEEAVKTEDDDIKRPRTMTKIGKLYKLEQIGDLFVNLKKITEKTLTLLTSHASSDVIRNNYHLWMKKFEMYTEMHQNVMSRLIDSDKEQYLTEYEDRDAYLKNFKRTIENYFTAQQDESESKQKRKGEGKKSSKSESSNHSTVLTQISSKRLIEEQKKAELEAKRNALRKKREIELAKVQLEIEEEELKISTDIAVVDAKTKVLDKYEKLEMEKSETNSFTTVSTGSYDSDPEPKSNVNDKTCVVDLNPKAQVFEPEIKVLVGRVDNKVIDKPKARTLYTTHNVKDNTKQNVQRVPVDLPAYPHDYNNNNTDAISAIVKSLRKPNPDIKKFSGDPLEFRKFVRQFTAKIIMNSDSEDEKMNYLEQFTYGDAHKVVQGFGHLTGAYAFKAAMKQLEDRYGDTEVIASAFIKKALDWPVLKAGDYKALDEFSLFLIECKNAAASINAMQILEYSENIKQLMCKLPFHFHDRWRNIVLRTKTSKQKVKFEHFVKFVEDEAKKVNDLTYGSSAVGSKGKQDTYRNTNTRGVRQGSTCATDLNTQSARPQECSYCKKQHKLENCTAIQKIEHQERLSHLKSQALCFGCLKKGHMTKMCNKRLTCSVCNRRHPTILHIEYRNENKQSSSVERPSMRSTSDHHDIASQIGAGDKSSCSMAIVPVKVKLRDKLKTIDTYAFFDTGSSISFCTESLMKQLGGSGKYKQVTLRTMGSPLKMNTCMLDGLQVCDIDMNHIIDLPTVYTKDEMPVSSIHIPTNDELSEWPHLNGVRLPDIDGTIGLMIGNNVPDAYTPFEVATGPTGSPHATKTRLGWIIWNLVRHLIPETYAVVNRAQLAAIHDVQKSSKLERLVQKSINMDFPERLVDDKRENSIEDNSFLEQVNETILFENGHYCIALPFKDIDMKFPNNESQGLQRLKGLRSKMIKNTKFKDDYMTFMDNLLTKGHAEKVPETELDQDDGRVWYIPHHGVYHPMKPNKIRVVFDCSATYMGVSLNRALLQGPDLANNLLGVLMRFRSETVPLLGDIESMFYQVKVPLKDRNYLRFLWWPNGDFESKPESYRMTVHLFGATSSPSVCNFALKRTAEEHGDQYEKEVSETIQKNMYVDDCLVSAESDEKAISLVENVRSLCKEGGFNLTKWMSSSPKVVDSIPEMYRAKEMKQWDLDTECSVERALGVFWYIDSDTLGFQVNRKSQPTTKRGILSTVSSVYDPIGIVSPFVLLGRTILQNLCKQGIGWDDEIQEPDRKKWNNWLYQLNDLPSVKITRCYKPKDFGKVVSTQLHCFSDASDIGLGMVFYLRLEDETHRIHCSFVLGKSRVAPLKTITVPRMELTAASKAVHLSKVIMNELSYSIDKVFFWTDSMTVLRYIFNRSARYHTFVANRLAVIHEVTINEQWNYVNTKINPADLASRGMTVSKFQQSLQWFRGPDFLWLPEDDWPKLSINLDILENDSEVKQVVNTITTENECNVIEKLLSRFSNIEKLRRISAWMLRAIQSLKRIIKIKHGQSSENKQNRSLRLQVNDIHNGESALIRYVQHQHFSDELQKLNTESSVKRSSKLCKLDPFTDKEGMLRVGGRLRQADLSNETKHPIILPKDSRLSYLIILDTHKEIGHLGKNSILTRLREKYWIIGANTIIKSIVSKCVVCRKYQAPIMHQKMADLPSDRVTPDSAPFTVVGIDYFGPFEIKQRRCTVKRYGVIFTCLKMRAVHLEIAHSLDTDSCINAIRRFISRRGVPKVIRSDNGTNFVGSERVLREEINKWNQTQLNNYMLQRNIEWKFNPPAASNFGGIWERLIRSVRKVLYSIMHEQNVRLDDENLHTLFCEVEAILNGRPITTVPDDVNDLKVLTPNDLLLLRKGSILPPGTFVKGDNYVKRRWRQVQYLADLFWCRWTKEYLPLLQQRAKWYKPERNLSVGDLVLIVDSTPRNSWTIGRIIEVVTDTLGAVRISKVKTPTTVLQRSVGKLCLVLESEL